ncbi:MAG: hypothetical protein F6K65_29685 [Moorea sp. SIO3C2]|nr:hypothetical protein [Moorena sp. SIO3C2]
MNTINKAESLLQQLPSINDQELQQNYINHLKWTETLVEMLRLVDNQDQVQRVVKLGLEVDWQLGARVNASNFSNPIYSVFKIQ